MTKWILGSTLACALAAATAGAQTATPSKPATPKVKPAAPQAPAAKPAGPLTAKPFGPGLYALFTTNRGNFIVRLFEKEAPRTVENFVQLARGEKTWRDPKTGTTTKRPFYTNLMFHRVRPKFMIQGGDASGTGRGNPGFTIRDEFNPKLRHSKAGIMSMANAGPNTGSSQFFITVAPTPWLDNRHSVFGEVVDGLDVVIAISNEPTIAGSEQPRRPVYMRSVRIERVS